MSNRSRASVSLEVLTSELRNLQKEMAEYRTTLDKIWGRIEALQQPKPTPWAMIFGLITVSSGLLVIWGRSEWGPMAVQIQSIQTKQDKEHEQNRQDVRWMWDAIQQRADHQDRQVSMLYTRLVGQPPEPFTPPKNTLPGPVR